MEDGGSVNYANPHIDSHADLHASSRHALYSDSMYIERERRHKMARRHSALVTGHVESVPLITSYSNKVSPRLAHDFADD